MSRNAGKMTMKFESISDTTEPFTLAPGDYVIEYAANCEEGGSVILQKLVADASSWINAMSAFTATGRIAATHLSGTYRVAVQRATRVFIKISRPELQ